MTVPRTALCATYTDIPDRKISPFVGIATTLRASDLHNVNRTKRMSERLKYGATSDLLSRVALVVAVCTLIVLLLSTFDWI